MSEKPKTVKWKCSYNWLGRPTRAERESAKANREAALSIVESIIGGKLVEKPKRPRKGSKASTP